MSQNQPSTIEKTHFMKAYETPWLSFADTVNQMFYMVDLYYCDMFNYIVYPWGQRFADLNPVLLFQIVKDMPYALDPEGDERLPRPAYIVEDLGRPRDCKKVSIVFCAWAKCNNVPYRLRVVSYNEQRDMQHIYPELKLNGEWLTFDATFSNFTVGQQMANSREELFFP